MLALRLEFVTAIKILFNQHANYFSIFKCLATKTNEILIKRHARRAQSFCAFISEFLFEHLSNIRTPRLHYLSRYLPGETKGHQKKQSVIFGYYLVCSCLYIFLCYDVVYNIK